MGGGRDSRVSSPRGMLSARLEASVELEYLYLNLVSCRLYRASACHHFGLFPWPCPFWVCVCSAAHAIAVWPAHLNLCNQRAFAARAQTQCVSDSFSRHVP